MHCPNCQTHLTKEMYAKVEIDRCPTCYGIWLDQGELDRLVDRRDHMVEITSIDHDPGIHGDNHPRRTCPHCQQSMKKVDLLEEDTGIIYDYCPNCKGFWLDHGEVARTKLYLKEHGKSVKGNVEAFAAMWTSAGIPPRPF